MRSSIQSARSANIPKENIKRAIDKSEVNTGSNFENIRYEGFGPSRVAVVVETLTDNKNRTASNLRTIFQKSGGSLGTQGSASHNFNQIGIIKIKKTEVSDDKIFELAIESGADECKSDQNFHEIHCDKHDIYNVKKNLEKFLKNFLYTGIEWLPIVYLDVKKQEKESIIHFLENLIDDDDVQNVYSNIRV